MTRPLRIHMPGKVYHLFARGDNYAPIFREDGDCAHFLEILAHALERFAIQCIAYCLMSNHYHVLAVPLEHSVSRLMHQVNSTYCQWFNRQHGRVGHVLQGRFGSRIVDDHDYLLTALRYVVLNPVAAGRVTRPEDWTWSSYRATAGLCENPTWLALEGVWTALGCTDAAVGRDRYITHIARTATTEELQQALVFGGDLLARQIRPLLEPHRENQEFRSAERFVTRPPLDAILGDADSTAALKQAAREAFHRHAYTLREIGDMVGRTYSTISKWMRETDMADWEGRGRASWHEKIGSDKFKI